jgi:hypothetical protein
MYGPFGNVVWTVCIEGAQLSSLFSLSSMGLLVSHTAQTNMLDESQNPLDSEAFPK